MIAGDNIEDTSLPRETPSPRRPTKTEETGQRGNPKQLNAPLQEEPVAPQPNTCPLAPSLDISLSLSPTFQPRFVVQKTSEEDEMKRILFVALFLLVGLAASSFADDLFPTCYICHTQLLDPFNRIAECVHDSAGLYSVCNPIEIPHGEAGGSGSAPTPVVWEECQFRIWECNKPGKGDGGGEGDPWWGWPLEQDPCNTGGFGYCSAECSSCY